MASASDSTRTPSRRAFFGSAVGAGFCAAQLPVFAGAAPDAALLAIAEPLVAAITASASSEAAFLRSRDDAAWCRWNEDEDHLVTVSEPLLAMRATTLEGLRTKALAARIDKRFAQSIVDDLIAMG